MKISELKTFVANLFAALFFHRVMKIINVQSQTVNILFAFVCVCVYMCLRVVEKVCYETNGDMNIEQQAS